MQALRTKAFIYINYRQTDISHFCLTRTNIWVRLHQGLFLGFGKIEGSQVYLKSKPKHGKNLDYPHIYSRS